MRSWSNRCGVTTSASWGSPSSRCTVRTTSQPRWWSSPPSPQRRLGVLLDHLVAGSKESRIASEVRDPNVLITGHPFVDVWAGVRPRVVGLDEWPEVPKGGLPWKEALCERLGVPFDGFWPRLRNGVTSYADLRPELVGAVEQLIDFVSE